MQTAGVSRIDHCYSFGEVPAAFDHLDRGAFGKIVIEL
ncbi:hypothetical protein FHT29_003767 [Rhizobium sp. SG741]|nr:hypothetical protein [Rhizobium sp. SG741]